LKTSDKKKKLKATRRKEALMSKGAKIRNDCSFLISYDEGQNTIECL
jgi:hypothetical protein